MFLGISSSFNSLIEFSSNSALVAFETVSSGIDVSFSGFFSSILLAGFSDMLEWRSAFLEQLDRNTKWPADQIEIIVDEIELVLHQGVCKEIKSIEIGEMVLTHLKDINEVAYIRFASVYRQFNGINDFLKTLEVLKPIKKEQLASVI